MKSLISHLIRPDINPNTGFQEYMKILTGRITMMYINVMHIFDAAAKILGDKDMPMPIVRLLDHMEIYGKDIERTYTDVCKENPVRFLIILWAFQAGYEKTSLGEEIPEFAKLETIKQIISEGSTFPFDEARVFIEENSSIVLPITA